MAVIGVRVLNQLGEVRRRARWKPPKRLWPLAERTRRRRAEPDRPRWFAFHGSSWGVAPPVVPPLAALAAVAAGTVGTGAFLAAGAAFLLVPFVLRSGG
ncbi:hypothetical protein [Nonomuraea typhae]|uniref:hypothetical protein n=1 Tax=Nonomuraea typhae TaxID=2603600 RepID=UPI0012FAC9DF|nr:hypothetical protein [Nonomuraea typhae]